MINPDLAFISHAHEDFEVPKEQKYLLKYFDTPLQEAYLKYWLVYKDHSNFVDHTGFACQLRWLKILNKKFFELEKAREEAKKNMDLSVLVDIEMGKYKI